MKQNRESTSSSSDDGYNSDNQSKQAQKHNIARDTATFKKKYQVVELINNSANGIIYSGKSFLLEIRAKFLFYFQFLQLF